MVPARTKKEIDRQRVMHLPVSLETRRVAFVAIRVDAATLHTAARDVEAGRNEMNSQLGKMHGVVEQTAPAWQGAAGASFQNVARRWRESSDKLLVAMEQIGVMLQESGTSAQVLDEEEQASMNRFGAALNP